VEAHCKSTTKKRIQNGGGGIAVTFLSLEENKKKELVVKSFVICSA
jgi:hypothetical protein